MAHTLSLSGSCTTNSFDHNTPATVILNGRSGDIISSTKTDEGFVHLAKVNRSFVWCCIWMNHLVGPAQDDGLRFHLEENVRSKHIRHRPERAQWRHHIISKHSRGICSQASGTLERLKKIK